MIFEYEKPAAEIVSFVTLETLATDDGDRTRSGEAGNEGFVIPSMPEFSEGVEDW